jgi:hypothetical protein
MRKLTFIILSALAVCSCNNSKNNKMTTADKSTSVCSDDCEAKSKSSNLSCKLTTAELQQRKITVLASLKAQIIEKKELKNGYAFKFSGTDKMLDELTEFIKTERECCNFFTFNLSISGDKSEVWLELKGQDGAKDFISTELGL